MAYRPSWQGPCRAAEAGDDRTVNLLEGIRDEQQKVLWMLGALVAA